MEYEKRDGDIVIFTNDKKGVAKRPDLRGVLRWQGKDLEIVLWSKKARSGATYLSGTVSEQEQKTMQPTEQQ